MVMVVCVHCPWHVAECYTPCVKNAPFHRGEVIIMMVRVCVDTAHGNTCVLYAPVSRALQSTGGGDDHGGACFVLPMVCIL